MDMTDALQKLEQSGVQMTASDSVGSEKAALQFIAEIVSNLELRFSDEVSKLCSLHDILKKKPSSSGLDFSNIKNVLKVFYKEMLDEWKFLQRLDGDLSTADMLLTLATSPQYEKMYPTFSAAVTRLLLLPIGTATVERSRQL
jgi:hypothetical protein